MSDAPDNATEPRPLSLFHYTDASGLLGILQSRTIWATEVRFLNDVQEGWYGREFLTESILQMRNPTLDPDHFAHQLGEAAETAFEYYRQGVIKNLSSPDFGVYVASFCESGDLLSQWRAYGSDHGYSIELNVGAVESSVAEFQHYSGSTSLSRVSYGIQTADSVVTEALNEVSQFNLNHPGVKAQHTALRLTSRLASIKHPGFAEEREWRSIVVFENWQLRENSSASVDLPQVPLRFRATPLAIASYIELKIPTEAVVSVRVGPGHDTAARVAGVERLLKSIGSTAVLQHSSVPLRS